MIPRLLPAHLQDQQFIIETESEIVKQKMAKFITIKTCHECEGSRINQDGRSVKLSGRNISSYTNMTIIEAKSQLNKMVFKGKNKTIAEKVLREINARLGFLEDVGLGYLTLSRKSNSSYQTHFRKISRENKVIS